MRRPKRPFVSGPGPLSPRAEEAQSHLRTGRAAFYDPSGQIYGLPTYPWRMTPAHLLTRRQLRARGLRMGGQPVQAQMVWCNGGRVAWLYDLNLAKPVRPMTAAMWRAHVQAMLARMTCPTCKTVQGYCISKYYGECNDCVDSNTCAA